MFLSNRKLGCLFLIFCSNGAVAFEVVVHSTGPNVRQIAKEIKPVYPSAKGVDVMCGKQQHISRFRINEAYAGLPFSIIAKKMTRVKIHWDNADIVVFPYAEERKTITFPRAGGLSQLYFRAYQPVSGNIYVSNEQGVIIKECPYSFLPAKHYSQSISFNTNEAQFENTPDSNSYSVNYRISSVSKVPSGGHWSVSGGVSQNEGSTESRRIHGSFSYNW